MGRITRGWSMAKLSWRVLKNDRSLALFPVISFFASMVAIAAIAFPGYLVVGDGPGIYVVGAIIAFAGTFVTVFFNVALVSCAIRSFEGHDTTIGEGIAAASSRIVVILKWTLLATTVGLALRALEERVPLAGRIAIWFVGAAWAIVTYFVVPVIAFEEVGPVEAVKRSGGIIKAQWGESLVGTVGINLVVGIITLVLFLPLLAGGFLFGTSALPLAVACGVAAVIVLVGSMIIGSTLTQIFNTALYSYATTGTAPGGFDSPQLESAFRRR